MTASVGDGSAVRIATEKRYGGTNRWADSFFMEKKKANLHLRLVLALGGIGIVCSLCVSLLNYFYYRNYILSSLQKTLANTGELIEKQMPVLGDIAYIRQEGIAESEAYMDILRKLKEYNDAYGFTFIYLMENNAGCFTYLLDTDRLGKNTDSTFMKPVTKEVAAILPGVIERRQTGISGFYTTEFGTFISAFVPIIRQSGVVGVIGLDYECSVVCSLLRKALLQIIFSLALTIAFVSAIAILISKKFVSLVRETDRLNKELRVKNENLATVSATDELTGLNNRRSFSEYIDIVWKQNHRLNLPITILMIDVDYFKKYNDSLGHLEGDKALVAVARRIKNHVKRDTDFVARFGGEEFVCVLPFTEKGVAVNFAKTLVASVELMEIPHPASAHSKYITISIGMATAVPDDNNTYYQLLDDADKALYAAKQSGRNRVVVD
jgi:diguanylate cyclase (GGDEF)-like protein